MATQEEELIQDAMSSTDKEIFGAAWGQEDDGVQDDTGDRTLEQMGEGLEGEHVAPDEEVETDDEQSAEETEPEGEEGEETEGEEGEEQDEEAAESEEDEAETEAETPEQKSPPQEPPPQGRVPPGRLREQTKRAERAEAALREHDAAQRAEIDGLKRQFEALTAALQVRQGAPQGAPPQPPPAPDKPPDQFEHPQEYTDWLIARQDRVNAETRQMLATSRFQNSIDVARATHGEKFAKAWEAVNKLQASNPDELAVAQRIFNAASPGDELMKWHGRQETLRVVGDDPEKYRQTIAAEVREAMKNDPEFRKQILDDLRAEASGDRPSKPVRHITRLPKSLNGATGQGSIREKADPDLYDDSDQSVFNSAWR